MCTRAFGRVVVRSLRCWNPKAFLVVVGVCVLFAACGETRRPNLADVKFDAAHAIALDVRIDTGRIITVSDNAEQIEDAINRQLLYSVGQLNGLNGGAPDMRRTRLTVRGSQQREDGLFEVLYMANLLVAWPREQAAPASYEFVLPARGDYQGLQEFFNRYGTDESNGKKCLAWEAHDVGASLFWYYYRPHKSRCDLRDPTLDPPDLVSRVTAALSLSQENTEGKSPEYHKVWEDGRLVVTAIFGKNEAGSTQNSDAGTMAFRELYQKLLRIYGRPASTNLEPTSEPGAVHDDVRLTFALAGGTVDIHLYLIDGVLSAGRDFEAKYSARTQISDFVSYSGHSGLGANIRALARMGEFVPGQYQIFMLNGCDTLAYVDGALQQAHQAANPNAGPDKYFDLITNAMPSYFHMNATSNLIVIEALFGKTKTYREILGAFDRYQRANVTGEQDNSWPQPFPFVAGPAVTKSGFQG